MPYFIMPDESSDLEVDPNDLSNRLRERWPMVEFWQKMPNESIVLRWTIEAGKVDHVGMLADNKSTLIIDDYPPGVSEFIVWYRKIIPEACDIFVYHDSDADLEVKVTRESTASEIEAAL